MNALNRILNPPNTECQNRVYFQIFLALNQFQIDQIFNAKSCKRVYYSPKT